MYKWGKPNQNTHKYKHTHHEHQLKTPTFTSSTLPTPHLQPKINNPRGAFQEHKMSSLRRACLVDKWMETKLIPRRTNPPPPPTKHTLLEEFDMQDALFFSTQRAEYSVFLNPNSNPHSSAPTSPRLNPVRTRSVDDRKMKKIESFEKNRSRAQKIYSNLKNLKQPISPGARLSSFITSIFAKDGKRMKNKKEEVSKSCLSRRTSSCSPTDGMKRTVRFSPSVSKILDEDDRGMRKEVQKQKQKQRQIEEVALDLLNGYWDAKMSKSCGQTGDYRVDHGGNYGQFEEDEDNDDRLSCSSSDLFELDTLSIIGDELPVYETTQFHPKIM